MIHSKKIPYILICLTYFCFFRPSDALYAQNNFLKVNLAGLFYPSTFDKEIRSEIPPTISIGFEKGFDSLKFTIGGQLNYGYTLLNFSSVTPGYDHSYIIAFEGISLFIDARKYFIKSRKVVFTNQKFEGIFLGLYSGIQNLNENQFVNYNYEDYSLTDFYLDKTQKIWVIGLGLEAGYKKTIYRKIYLEVMGGFGYGYVTKEKVPLQLDNYINSRALNLLRFELSIGSKI